MKGVDSGKEEMIMILLKASILIGFISLVVIFHGLMLIFGLIPMPIQGIGYANIIAGCFNFFNFFMVLEALRRLEKRRVVDDQVVDI